MSIIISCFYFQVGSYCVDMPSAEIRPPKVKPPPKGRNPFLDVLNDPDKTENPAPASETEPFSGEDIYGTKTFLHTVFLTKYVYGFETFLLLPKVLFSSIYFVILSIRIYTNPQRK